MEKIRSDYGNGLMKVLLVNDDGIDSPRLKYMEKILSKYVDVWVVAPKAEQSAKSMSITTQGVKFEKISEQKYAIAGTPADCILFAHYGLSLEPELVISGINYGLNVGFDTFYSGTVSAALQACFLGFPSIAFSGDPNGMKNIEENFEDVMEHLFEYEFYSSLHVLNVNFPLDEHELVNGLYHSKIDYTMPEMVGNIKDDEFKIKRYLSISQLNKDSEQVALARGKISISRINFRKLGY